jgi:hypothetical protein
MKPEFMNHENGKEGIRRRLDEPSYVANSLGNAGAFGTQYSCYLQALITVLH